MLPIMTQIPVLPILHQDAIMQKTPVRMSPSPRRDAPIRRAIGVGGESRGEGCSTVDSMGGELNDLDLTYPKSNSRPSLTGHHFSIPELGVAPRFTLLRLRLQQWLRLRK